MHNYFLNTLTPPHRFATLMTTTDVKESTVDDITDVVWVLFVVAVDDDVAVVGAFVVFRATVLNTLVFVF